MAETINVSRLRQPDDVEDPLTDVMRSGARRLPAQTVEQEAGAFPTGKQVVEIGVADGMPIPPLRKRRPNRPSWLKRAPTRSATSWCAGGAQTCAIS